jgi:hypothetical protein
MGSSAAGDGDTADSGRSSGGGTKSRGGTGGSAMANGGTSRGGASTGGVSTGGAAQGGASGQGGDAGEAAGEGGEPSGSGGTLAGTGGTAMAGSGSGGDINDPDCDPATGELDNTPYPNCEPRDVNSACELCIQANCCEASKVCYGYDPGNVCGWGGPTTGSYAGLSEIDCYVQCARDYVSENLAYDDYTADVCVPACTTSACGLIGSATQDLVVCLNQNCEADCFEQP